jgi:hypothetical protein
MRSISIGKKLMIPLKSLCWQHLNPVSIHGGRIALPFFETPCMHKVAVALRHTKRISLNCIEKRPFGKRALQDVSLRSAWVSVFLDLCYALHWDVLHLEMTSP